MSDPSAYCEEHGFPVLVLPPDSGPVCRLGGRAPTIHTYCTVKMDSRIYGGRDDAADPGRQPMLQFDRDPIPLHVVSFRDPDGAVEAVIQRLVNAVGRDDLLAELMGVLLDRYGAEAQERMLNSARERLRNRYRFRGEKVSQDGTLDELWGRPLRPRGDDS